MDGAEKLDRINDIVYQLFFTSFNLTQNQKELLNEIRLLSEDKKKSEDVQ